MRISDWSSDVCSSDLRGLDQFLMLIGHIAFLAGQWHGQIAIAFGLVIEPRPQSIKPITVTGGNQCGMKGLMSRSIIFLQPGRIALDHGGRSDEHTSELPSLMRL